MSLSPLRPPSELGEGGGWGLLVGSEMSAATLAMAL